MQQLGKYKMKKQTEAKATIKQEVTPEEATKVLQELEAKKQEACNKELLEVLNKYGYRIGVQAQPVLVPAEKS